MIGVHHEVFKNGMHLQNKAVNIMVVFADLLHRVYQLSLCN
jgi:hypothetical protein